MARPTLWTHRKFIRLTRLLGARYRAIGVLECIWRPAYESGDPCIGDSDDVEDYAGWDGEPGELVTVLVKAGFLDRLDDGSLAVHDLDDHCPEYVRSRKRMEKYRKKVKAGEIEHPNQFSEATVTQPLRNGYGSPTPTPFNNKASKPCLSAGPTPAMLLETWNANRGPLPAVKALSAKRIQAAKSRLHDIPDIERWIAAVKRIAASSFCRGEGKTAWVANFDWLLRPDTLLKIEEGRYDDRGKATSSSGESEAEKDAKTRRAQEQIEAIARQRQAVPQ